MREGASPNPSPLLRRATPNVRAVTKSQDTVDGNEKRTPSPSTSPTPSPTSPTSPPTSPQLGKLIIRAAKSPDRAPSPDYVRTPATVVGPKSPTSPHRQVRGAYVNVQAGDEGKTTTTANPNENVVVKPIMEMSRNLCDDDAKPFFTTKNSMPVGKYNNPGNLFLASNFDPTRTNHADDNHHPVESNNVETTTNQHRVRSNKHDSVNVVNSADIANSQSNLDKPSSSSFCPRILKPAGNTPKLNRKLLISDFDAPNYCRKIVDQNDIDSTIELVRISNDERSSFSTFLRTTNDDNSTSKDSLVEYADNNSESNSDSNSTKRGTRDDRIDRKIKRSESYRMANSPIMFIKKFSGANEKSTKIFRTPSEELQEELLKERINYPETVSSPEPPIEPNVNYGNGNGNLRITMPIVIIPSSPRPRALDLQPVKVLEYSGNDTEIW